MTKNEKIWLGIAGIGAAISAIMFLNQSSANAATVPGSASNNGPASGGSDWLNSATTVTNDPSRGDPTVQRYQGLLRGLGYDPGPVDGRTGPLTRRAVSDFQRDQGIAVTGNLNAATQNAIDTASNDASSPTPTMNVQGNAGRDTNAGPIEGLFSSRRRRSPRRRY